MLSVRLTEACLHDSIRKKQWVKLGQNNVGLKYTAKGKSL